MEKWASALFLFSFKDFGRALPLVDKKDIRWRGEEMPHLKFVFKWEQFHVGWRGLGFYVYKKIPSKGFGISSLYKTWNFASFPPALPSSYAYSRLLPYPTPKGIGLILEMLEDVQASSHWRKKGLRQELFQQPQRSVCCWSRALRSTLKKVDQI